jgi:signal transduction histidine kinase/ketosteroid isomerase-like protein
MPGGPRTSDHAESSRAIALRHYAAFDAKDVAGWRRDLADDVVFEGFGTTLRGADAVTEYVEGVMLANPAMLIDVEVLVEGPDAVVLECRSVEPEANPTRQDTDAKVSGAAWHLMRFREGRIVHVRTLDQPAPGYDTDSITPNDELLVEQTALRRVATLVAKDVAQEEVFDAVNEEAGRVVGADATWLLRFAPDDVATLIAAWPQGTLGPHVGARRVLGADIRALRQMKGAVRADVKGTPPDWPFSGELSALGIRSSIGVPIVVEGRPWGMSFAAVCRSEPLPEAAIVQLLRFTELVSATLANAHKRRHLEELAEEQAALRRVATLVAQGAVPDAVFDAVAAEMAALLQATGITLCRYEPGEELTVLAHLGPEAWQIPAGTRVRHDGKSVSATVRRTHRPARMDSYADTHGHIGQVIEGLRFRSGVGAPIVVEGKLWGTTIANWAGDDPPPEDTEERMANFTQLLETAIANADGRGQLTASRVRLLTEADEARRRVVRDLHDGAQQRLVHAIVTLKLAQQALRNGSADAESLVGEALAEAQEGNEELRELARGILPAALARGGLRAGIDTVVARVSLPVHVDVPADRLSTQVEASAYFIVAEVLTNLVKHAHATRAQVKIWVEAESLHTEIRDDGIGGADPSGHGLVGISDRVTALGGRLKIDSPPGRGTLVAATLPLTR